MKAPVIYKIINVTNQKFYVGSTMDTRERFRTHRNKLRGNRHHCAHLQAAWNKYGEDCFKFVVVEEVPTAEGLQAAEDAWLQAHVGEKNCYNAGLRSGAPWRGVSKERHPNYGRPMPAGQKARIAKTLKATYAATPGSHPRLGKTHTEETKAKISTKKLENPSRHWADKERSVETREKIGAAQRGVKKGPRTYSEDGLARAQENMRNNAREQLPLAFAAVHAKFPPEVRAKYDFSAAVYTGALNRITGCVCPTHGEFTQYAVQFRKGRGCPECGKEELKATVCRPIQTTDDTGAQRYFESVTALRAELGMNPGTADKALKSGRPLSKGARKGWSFKYVAPTDKK